jgi:hypothetical protein
MAMATYTNPLTDNLMGVINMSPEVQALNKWLTTPDFPKYGTTVGEQNYLKGYVRYLSNNHELFARAYAQYVMTKLVKAGKIPQRYLTGLQESNKLWGSIEKVSQWQTDNFEPIEKAFDDFFAMYNGMVQNKYDNAVNLK